MTDKLRNSFINIPEFVDGELPTSLKLNACFKSILGAFSKVEEAIGDITVKDSDNTPLSNKPLTIGSIGRFLGPLESFQPNFPTRTEFLFSIPLATGTNTWTLPLWPRNLSGVLDINVSISSPIDYQGSSLFAVEKAAADPLVALGDWKYDPIRNKIHSYSPLASGTVDIIGTSYLAADADQGIGNYWNLGNATPNVQPSFNVVTPTSITVSSTSHLLYNYKAVMGVQAYDNYSPINNSLGFVNNNSALQTLASTSEYLEQGANPFYGVSASIQQRLPYGIDVIYTADDEIARPFVVLYDETNDVLLNDARYFYIDTTSFGIKTGSLNVSNNYRVITNGGVDISSQLKGLTYTLQYHRHDGPNSLSHDDMSKLGYSPTPANFPAIIGTDIRHGWHRPTQVSKIPGNPHPQYLMRNGYSHGMDLGNKDNMFTGDFVLAQYSSTTYEPFFDSVNNYESWPISFAGKGQARLARIKYLTGGPVFVDNYKNGVYLSGEKTTGASNSALNIGIFTNETAPSEINLNATNTLLEVAGSNFYIGHDPSIGNAVGLSSNNSNIRIIGTDNICMGSHLNSRTTIIGSTNKTKVVHGPLTDFAMQYDLENIGMSNVVSHTAVKNSKLSYVGSSITAGTSSTFINSRLEVTGSNLTVSNINFQGASVEVVFNGATVVLPTIVDGDKYFKTNNFFVDADKRSVIKSLSVDMFNIVSSNDKIIIANIPSEITSTSGITGKSFYTTTPGTVAISANSITHPSHDLARYLYLEDDSHLKEIKIHMSYEEANLKLFYVTAEGNTVLATSTSLPISGGSAGTIIWTLGTGIGTKGDRFPSLTGNAVDMYLLVEQTKGTPTIGMAVYGGTYEYYRMRF